MANPFQRLRALFGLDRRSQGTTRGQTAAAFRAQAARKQNKAALVVKPCPFCGMRPAEALDDLWTSDGGYFFQIVCLPCGAAGPQMTTEDGAWKAWNERMTPREH